MADALLLSLTPMLHPWSCHFACAPRFLQGKLRVYKMRMRIVLAFILGGKGHFSTAVPAFSRPWLAAMALKTGRCFAGTQAGHGDVPHPKHCSRGDGEQAARCRQSPRAAGSGSEEAAWLSPACPHFQPDSSRSAGASCHCSALLLPSPPRLACRPGLASVCHQDLTPACQRAALARNGLGERGRRWQRSQCGDCPGTAQAKSAAGLARA